MIKLIKLYIKNNMLGLDLFANTLTAGKPREYISQRLGRWKSRSTIARRICYIMTHTLFGDKHCERAFKNPGEGEAVNDSPTAGLVIFILLGIAVYFYLT